jgi:acyl-CoA thioester hydrolase
MVSEFSITRTVDFAETDMAGIMHFSNFFRWMESCETALYRSLGLPVISFVPGQAVGWPRVKATCDFRAPLRFGDTAEVRLYIKDIGHKSLTMVFQFRRITKGRLEPDVLAQGEIVAVAIASDARGNMTAQPIPETVRAKLRMAPKSAWSGE